ncbi:MAG: hypothetical protein LBK06_03955 [Planctomycetaceae bacterium]|nr:hypothetical protein [Planctomycetaceae bacterium]
MTMIFVIFVNRMYAEAVLKFAKQNTAAQQREAVVQGRSLLPYRLRYNCLSCLQIPFCPLKKTKT